MWNGSWVEMGHLGFKTISNCVVFYRFSSHDLEEWCLLTYRCLYSHTHFSNIFTEADACLKNKSSTDENLTPASTNLIFFKKVGTQTLAEIVRVIILCAPEADSSTVYWLCDLVSYLSSVYFSFLINKSKANRVNLSVRFFYSSRTLAALLNKC